MLELVAEGVGSANGIEVHVLNAVRDCMELVIDDSDCMPVGELFVVAEELKEQEAGEREGRCGTARLACNSTHAHALV